MFKIHEFSSEAGELSSVSLRLVGEQLEITSKDGTWPLPEAAVHAVLARFGAPFDESARFTTLARFSLPNGAELSHVRHLSRYDVIARDYIVYRTPGDALCALATTVAAALLHLGRAGQQVV